MSQARPYLSKFTDRHGRIRWRFRRKGKTVPLAGSPGEPGFEEAYAAAIENREPRVAAIEQMPGAALPQTFGAAWREVQKTAKWLAFKESTRLKNTRLTESFLSTHVVPDAEDTPQWRDVPIADFKRRHAKMILADHAETPHAAKHLLTAVRRMIDVAIDEEWIEIDPTAKIQWRPKYKGWRAWTDEEMAAFEKRWPIGSTPRLVYTIGLWLGHRRSDITTLEWAQIDHDTVKGSQIKTGRNMILPMTPVLREVLAATKRRGPTVIVTQYGKPFSEKSLTGRMRDWTKAAGLKPGCTLHGLRKTLGRLLAESGASTRQLMEVLGHDDIQHAELYSRDAEKARLARDGMSRVVSFQAAKKLIG